MHVAHKICFWPVRIRFPYVQVFRDLLEYAHRVNFGILLI